MRHRLAPRAALRRDVAAARRARRSPATASSARPALVNGRPIACYAQDGRFFGGALGELHAETIVRVLQTAERARIPVVGFVESGGARIQEGTAALAGYGQIFRETVRLTGVVPQISIVSGASAGGGAYSPALTDLIVMTEDAAMFLTGPGVVRDALGEEIDAAEPRRPARPRPQRRLPPRRGRRGERRRARAGDPRLPALGRRRHRCRAAVGARWPTGENPGDFVPAEHAARLRRAARAARDRRPRLDPRAAPPLGAQRRHRARADRRPAGRDRRQPAALPRRRARRRELREGGAVHRVLRVLRAAAVAVVDTPGFMPGSKQEAAGVIRHGASLVRAFAAARVPKFTVVLRKSYGGAYITMNSRDLGSDLVMAWPDAELGIMSAKAAVGIVNRRQLRVAPDPEAERDRLAEIYAEEHLRADSAAAAGIRRRDHRAAGDPRPADPCARDVQRRARRCRLDDDRRPAGPGRSPGDDPGGQAPADHRRHHEGLDRLPRRRAGAARGRRGAADELRAGQADDRARRAAAAGAGRRARARRQPARGPRGAHGDAARALGRASTARCTRSRSRPRMRSGGSS